MIQQELSEETNMRNSTKAICATVLLIAVCSAAAQKPNIVEGKGNPAVVTKLLKEKLDGMG